MRRIERPCPRCGCTIKAKTKRTLCRPCGVLSLRWSNRRHSIMKRAGVDIGGFENCKVFLAFTPKRAWHWLNR